MWFSVMKGKTGASEKSMKKPTNEGDDGKVQPQEARKGECPFSVALHTGTAIAGIFGSRRGCCPCECFEYP